MHRIQKFFLFCSGAEQQIIKRTPTELNRLAGIGACVFFTGVFAFVAASYAIYTVFDSVMASLLFGLLWGLMIFNLDRYIVSTLRKKTGFMRELGSVVPRLVLAVFIAVVIAKPLELKIFESEINAELALMQQENRAEQESIIRSRFTAELVSLNEDISALKNEIEAKAALRDKSVEMALAEADGTGGSGIRNMGPIYSIKKKEADKQEMEYATIKARNENLVAQKQERIAMLEESMDEALTSITVITKAGLASRIQALSRLTSKNHAIFLASIFIMLLFVAVETAPIFVKLMSERSPYDFVLDKHEFAYRMNHKRINSLLENDTHNAIDYELKTSRHRTELLIEAENRIMAEALKSELSKVDPLSVKWRGILKRSGLFASE